MKVQILEKREELGVYEMLYPPRKGEYVYIDESWKTVTEVIYIMANDHLETCFVEVEAGPKPQYAAF